MELVEYICMSEYVCTVVFFIFSFKDVFILINFSSCFFSLFFTWTYTVWYNIHVYVCSGTLLYTNSKVVHVEFFCEVSFVFSDCRMFAGLQHLAGLETFLFCVANSFSWLFFSLNVHACCSFTSSSSQSKINFMMKLCTWQTKQCIHKNTYKCMCMYEWGKINDTCTMLLFDLKTDILLNMIII